MVNGTMYEHASGTLTWAPHDSGTKFVEVRLFWENIPPEAELTLGVTLTPVLNAGWTPRTRARRRKRCTCSGCRSGRARRERGARRPSDG